MRAGARHALVIGVALLALFASALCASRARAEEPEVPVRLQAELLAKVVGYDRSYADRAGDRAVVLIAVRAGDPDSMRIGAELMAELERQKLLGGVPHEERIVRYTSALALANAARELRASIVYLSAGFEDEAAKIASAVADASVLTVSAVGRYVERGIVLGFLLESSKPKIVIHLAQARRQGIDFRANLLKLARVLP